MRAGQPEGMDVRHDIVPDLALFGLRRGKVDPVQIRAHLLDRLGRDGLQAEFALSFRQSEPYGAPGADAVALGEEPPHGRRRVARGKRVFPGLVVGHRQAPHRSEKLSYTAHAPFAKTGGAQEWRRNRPKCEAGPRRTA